MEKHFIKYESLTFGKMLGRGQFGAVYRGTCDGEAVAIKKISNTENENIPMNEDVYLQREVEILNSLRHAHVLRFKGICSFESSLFIITEYADGGDLRNYLKANNPTWEQRLKIAIQIAQAIEYLHSRNIVHRDIKTENVLMDTDCNIKLGDFGFAREVNSKAPNNYTFCGSEFFEAPEIMFCMDYDERVDIFSYGMVLCELISRKQPSMVNFKRVVPGFGIAADEIRSLANEGCPEPMLTIVCECCNDDPDRRPELNLAVTELKVAYRELSGTDYVDVKNKEQLEMEEQKRLEHLRMLEEAEEEERLEREAELQKQKEMEVAVKILSPFPGASIRAKSRADATMKIDANFFEKSPEVPPSPTLILPQNPVDLPSRGSVDQGRPSMDSRGSIDSNKKTLRSSSKDGEVSDLLRTGRLLLTNKYVQISKEDHDLWMKFVVGFQKSIPVQDRQIRVFGRIRTYRRCFTSEDVIDCIQDLCLEIKTKKAAMEIGDLLVKMSFFFNVVGGTSFKEGALYRFHADEAKTPSKKK